MKLTEIKGRTVMEARIPAETYDRITCLDDLLRLFESRPAPPRYQLDLSRRELDALRVLCEQVGGDSKGSLRSVTNRLDELAGAALDVESVDCEDARDEYGIVRDNLIVEARPRFKDYDPEE